jgi:hypothetical protein
MGSCWHRARGRPVRYRRRTVHATHSGRTANSGRHPSIHVEMAGLPGAMVGSVIAVRPERHADDDTAAPGYSLPLWLAKVMTAVNAHGCKIQWYEGDYTTGRVELGDAGRAWKGSLVVVVRHTAPTTTADPGCDSGLLVGGEPDGMAAWRRDDSVPHTRSNENSLGPEVVRADEEGAAHSGRPRSRRGRSIEREVVCDAGRSKRVARCS